MFEVLSSNFLWLGEGLQKRHIVTVLAFLVKKKYIEAFQSVYFLTKHKKNLKSTFLFTVILVVL